MLTERRREITKRAADLCRVQPAVFAAVVRQADRLRAQGVGDEDALDRAGRSGSRVLHIARDEPLRGWWMWTVAETAPITNGEWWALAAFGYRPPLR